MKTGTLRHLVTLDVPNGNNSYLPLDPATWYCATLSEGSGQATLIGRFHPGITTATRVHFKGRVYHVDSIVNREERDVELVLSCREVFD
jgi:Phage head-tail joining protein